MRVDKKSWNCYLVFLSPDTFIQIRNPKFEIPNKFKIPMFEIQNKINTEETTEHTEHTEKKLRELRAEKKRNI